MPHRCIRCGKIYAENAIELIRGCGCGARLFLYMKKEEDLQRLGNVNWIEKELRGIAERKEQKPLSLEIENVRLLEKGVFELNLKSLILNRDPIVVRDSYGVYYVKLPKKPSSILKKED